LAAISGQGWRFKAETIRAKSGHAKAHCFQSSFLSSLLLVEDTVTGLDSLCFAQRASLDVESVCVMDEAVEDGMGQGGISDGLGPELDRHLRSDHRGSVVVAIFAQWR
jgi:hypothetical protein